MGLPQLAKAVTGMELMPLLLKSMVEVVDEEHSPRRSRANPGHYTHPARLILWCKHVLLAHNEAPGDIVCTHRLCCLPTYSTLWG